MITSLLIHTLSLLKLVGLFFNKSLNISSHSFSIALTSCAVYILLSLIPNLFNIASSFASMAVILSSQIRPFPFNLLLLPEASDGAL